MRLSEADRWCGEAENKLGGVGRDICGPRPKIRRSRCRVAQACDIHYVGEDPDGLRKRFGFMFGADSNNALKRQNAPRMSVPDATGNSLPDFFSKVGLSWCRALLRSSVKTSRDSGVHPFRTSPTEKTRVPARHAGTIAKDLGI
jgi:hypothetical protein